MSVLVPTVLGASAAAIMVGWSAMSQRRRKPTKRAANDGKRLRVLVHDINDDRCTGCDACVAVCPTNVLDLVNNKSRVMRFQDCIQCEACMWACPTEALVMHVEGTSPPPLKVPDIDQDFQTRVPGQYLIGEVAGKPLVKNAANLGRAVIEHALATGLTAGALDTNRSAEGSDAHEVGAVDVAIVGSGPGGLSAALTCINKGLSYVVLEKDQAVASTIANYPKGKLIMAEPYDIPNLSFLPIFDSNKEQILSIWDQLRQEIGININLGESVEGVSQQNGVFQVQTNARSYRAQRVVIATGLRGKPRTLNVPGETLPKVQSLLSDPALYRGQSVLVVGGGDSAVEAALALADAGARVVMSYRGQQFARCQPKNRSAIEGYTAQGRIKVRYESQVEHFTEDRVTLIMKDGIRKTYPNEAAFILIGSDPPVRWLSKLGVEFVERPHSFAFPASHELVQRFAAEAAECPDDAHNAARLIQRGELPAEKRTSGRTGWVRRATSLFAPKRNRQQSQFGRTRMHTGHGRRDDLSPGERTRVLRMLRDEGGRLAHDESAMFAIPVPPPTPGHPQSPPPGDSMHDLNSFMIDDEPTVAHAPARDAVPNAIFTPEDSAPPPPLPQPSPRASQPVRPAVMVGLSQAKAARNTRSAPPPLPAAANRNPVGESTSDLDLSAIEFVGRNDTHHDFAQTPRHMPTGTPALPPASAAPLFDEPTQIATLDPSRLFAAEDETHVVPLAQLQAELAAAQSEQTYIDNPRPTAPPTRAPSFDDDAPTRLTSLESLHTPPRPAVDDRRSVTDWDLDS